MGRADRRKRCQKRAPEAPERPPWKADVGADTAPDARGPRRRDPARDLRVLHRGAEYAVVQKPAGLACGHDRAAPGQRPLLDAVERLLGVEHARLVHRLDKETSGCLLVAWTKAAQRHLSIELQKRRVDKAYLALVCGLPDPTEQTVTAPLENDPRGGGRMRIAHRGRSEGGRPRRRLRAETRFRTLLTFRRWSLVLAEPHTGRQHQIRIHLQRAGCPLAVDPLYGDGTDGIYLSTLKPGYRASSRRPEPPICGRLTLHAWKLGFEDPGGRRVDVRAPLPRDLRRTLDALVRYDHPLAVR